MLRKALATATKARRALPARALRPAACVTAARLRPVATLQAPRWAVTRALSTDASDGGAMDENRFMELADGTLHDILEWLDGIDEMLEESDISLAQGVLKIDLGDDGTWVINRQIPNRQIWWSSPISGPRRYEFDAARGEWLNTRDGTELVQLLRQEIAETTGIEIYD